MRTFPRGSSRHRSSRQKLPNTVNSWNVCSSVKPLRQGKHRNSRAVCPSPLRLVATGWGGLISSLSLLKQTPRCLGVLSLRGFVERLSGFHSIYASHLRRHGGDALAAVLALSHGPMLQVPPVGWLQWSTWVGVSGGVASKHQRRFGTCCWTEVTIRLDFKNCLEFCLFGKRLNTCSKELCGWLC